MGRRIAIVFVFENEVNTFGSSGFAVTENGSGTSMGGKRVSAMIAPVSVIALIGLHSVGSGGSPRALGEGRDSINPPGFELLIASPVVASLVAENIHTRWGH